MAKYLWSHPTVDLPNPRANLLASLICAFSSCIHGESVFLQWPEPTSVGCRMYWEGQLRGDSMANPDQHSILKLKSISGRKRAASHPYSSVKWKIQVMPCAKLQDGQGVGALSPYIKHQSNQVKSHSVTFIIAFYSRLKLGFPRLCAYYMRRSNHAEVELFI